MARDIARDVETVFWSSALEKQLTISSQTCWPCDEPAVLPWCPLVQQGDSPPHSTPYMQLHKLSESRGESIERISSEYKGKADLQVLFVIAEEKHQILSSNDLLKDMPFLTVIIRKRYKNNIMTLLQNASDVKATVTVLLGKRSELARALLPKNPDSHVLLFKAIQHVIQNGIVVSLSSGVHMICPPNKRLLSCLLETIHLQHIEAYIDLTASSNTVQVFQLLQQRCFFQAHFPKDFIFFFNLGYCNYSNQSSFVSGTSFMMKCLDELLQVPIDDVNKLLRLFLELGDFEAELWNIIGTTRLSIFEHTAKSLLKHCDIYFEIASHQELIHVSLLLISVALKLYHSDKKLVKKADNIIWSKKFSEYFKSGFSLQDVSCLDKGLHAMTVILANNPQLMAGWNDFYFIFLNKTYNFEIMRKFIAVSVKHLVGAEDDTSFRVSFLQPITASCLTASRKKKASVQFSADNVLLEGKEYLIYLTQVISEWKWNLENYRIILEDWLKIVFNLIDLSEPETRSHLIKWISEEEKQLWCDGGSCFYSELEELLIRQSHDLPVDALIAITNTIENETFNKPKIIIEYLGHSKVPKLLSEEPVRDLMIRAMTCVTKSNELISYFKTVIDIYKKSKKPLKFFEDLMSLTAQPSPEFEEQLMNLISTNLLSTSNFQKLLKEQLESFFSSIPLTSNSFNWLVMEELLKKSLLLPGMDIDKILKCVSALFFNDMREEHFSSTRIRAALFVIQFTLKDAILKDFSCLHEYSFPLFVFSQSFLTMWTAFTTLKGSLKGNHTLEAFQMSTLDTPEVQAAIKMIRILKDLVSITDSCGREKDVTYSDMSAIQSGYDTYKSISDCVTNVFGHYQLSHNITREQIKEYQSSFNDYVREIESLLVRRPKNLPDLARENVKSVLAGYDIFLPTELELGLKATVKPSSCLIENKTSSQSFIVYTYHGNPECTLASLESFTRRLREFLSPLHDSIDVLVFNSLHKSQILKKCIEHFHTRPKANDPPAVKMWRLNDAVQKAQKIIELLVDNPEDTLSLKDVTDIFRQDDLKTYDLLVEDKELYQFSKLKGSGELPQQVSPSQSLMTVIELYACKQVKFADYCVTFTKDNLQKLAKEKQNISDHSFSQHSLSFEGIITALQQMHDKGTWLSTNFDLLLQNCEELLQAFEDIKNEASNQVNMLEKAHQEKCNECFELKELYDDLMVNQQRKEEEHHHLIESHNDLVTKYQLMEKSQQDLVEETETKLQLQHEEYQLMENNQQELVKKIEDMQATLTLQQEEYHHLKQSFSNLMTQYQVMEKSQEEKNKEAQSQQDELINRIAIMENNWKISHKEVTLSETELGRGGWGKILEGEFRGQKVAIKQIHELINSVEYMELLHREINAMSQLRHPNILQFIGAVFDHPSGNPMIITEVMDTSLRKAYESKELTPDPSCRPVILSIMRDVAVGLNYLHCLPDPIIHRDVSSSNVLLESKGPRKWKTKISDFGSAKSVQLAVTKVPGAVVYSPPEAHQTVATVNRKQTTKMDSFSYGVLLCEMLLCQFPSIETFSHFLGQVKASSPKSLYGLIVSCISEEPEKRPVMEKIIQLLK